MPSIYIKDVDQNKFVKLKAFQGEKGEKGDPGQIKFIVVNELPTENIDESAIYMKSSSNQEEQNSYEEFIYVNGVWESLGTTQIDIDLSNCVKNTDYATNKVAGVIMWNSSYGTEVTNNGILRTVRATESDIDDRKNVYKPIVPSNLDYALKDTFLYRGNIINLGYTSFAECTEIGYYSVSSAQVTTLSDAGSIKAGGSLIVLPKYGSGDTVGQSFIDVNQNIWARYGTNAFVKAGLSSNDNVFIRRGDMSSLKKTTFASCTDTGYYAFNTSYISSITDKPSNLTSGGMLWTFKSGGGASYNRLLVDIDGNMWYKYASKSWVQIVNTTTASLEPTRWCAMGDSITEGYYSHLKDDGTATCTKSSTNSWVYKVSKYNGYALTNKGIGGSGYTSKGSDNSKTNGRELVETIDFTQFNLVTLAYGCNDWKYNSPLGSMEDDVETGGTIYSDMRYVIEKIMQSNPACKIIVITPINCCYFGNYETNYGLSKSFSNNGTLEDIFNAFVEVCEYYGIEYIDMTHSSVINRQNITNLLIDGVHPSIECYELMARELAKKIMIL